MDYKICKILRNKIFINAVNDLAERGVDTLKKLYHKVNNYQWLNQISVTSEHERKLLSVNKLLSIIYRIYPREVKG